MQSILKDCFSKRTALLFILPLFAGSVLFSMPHAAHGQAKTTAAPQAIQMSDLTPANGWTCDTFNKNCTNNKPDSPWYKGTASCSQASSRTDDVIRFNCIATAANGDTSVGVTSVGAAGAQTVGAAADGVVDAQDKNATGAQKDFSGAGVGGDGCGLGGVLGGNIGQCIINAIGLPILSISTFFLGIAGVLFNFVVVKTVFQFSQLIGNAPGLLLAWGILRDLGNMVLLFGFIFMGLATILDLHTYNAKKALPPLIIFAVLMNFSLFAAEAVIDVSNAFSSVLYAQANNAQCGFSGTVNATNTAGNGAGKTADENIAASEKNIEGCLNVGIAGNIMQASGLSTIFSLKPQNVSLVVYIGLSLFAVIGAIVMLAASIMLIVRVVTLTLLMVFAPIGFAGMAVPPLRSVATKWWSMLIHQAFFAPLLLLLIFISLKVTEDFGTVSGAGLAGALSDPNVSTMGVILVFVIIIGFLIGSLKAASSFGAIGASYAIKTAGGLVAGTYGTIGRRTLGAGSNFAAKQIGKTKFGRTTQIGNFAYDIANKGAKSSFDVRASKAGGLLASTTKLDFGQPGKAAAGGFAGVVEEAKKAKEARAKGFTLSDAEETEKKNAEAALAAEEQAQKDRDKDAKEAQRQQRDADELELGPMRESLDKIAKEIKTAREEGRESDAKALDLQYNNSLRAYDVKKKAADENLKQMQDNAVEAKKSSDELIEATKANIKKIEQRPKTQYADSLAGRGISIGKVNFTSKEANTQAAKAIREDLKKSKTDKSLEAILHAVEHGGDDTKKAVAGLESVIKPAAGGSAGGDHGGGSHDH